MTNREKLTENQRKDLLYAVVSARCEAADCTKCPGAIRKRCDQSGDYTGICTVDPCIDAVYAYLNEEAQLTYADLRAGDLFIFDVGDDHTVYRKSMDDIYAKINLDTGVTDPDTFNVYGKDAHTVVKRVRLRAELI